MDEREQYFKKKEEYFSQFVYDLADWCRDIVDDIIPRICHRAIRRMNHWEDPITVDGHTLTGKVFAVDGGYPKSFNFFDVLSIQIQEYNYDEINPYLRDAIEDVLEYEMSLLPRAERLVLYYSTAGLADDYGCDNQLLQSRLFDCFHDMLNEHWETKKIQNFTASQW